VRAPSTDIFKSNDARVDAVVTLYFFLLSDSYREFREAEARWECYSAAQFHFDDGVKLILDSGEDYPVDHPVWSLYGEKVAEIAGRIARFEERKREKLAAFKGVHAGFIRFCSAKQIDAKRVTPGILADNDKLSALDTPDVPPSGQVADETYGMLMDEWARHDEVGAAA